jgi:DNA-binding response OmpR family regulator
MSLLDLFKKDDGKPTILIVEDSRTQAMQLEFLLEGGGYAVVVARNGKEAVKTLEKLKPVMVISDIVMPEMDGHELCLHIKTNDDLKEIPVILMTALTDSNEAIKGLYSGADMLIAKPYQGDFLLARIASLRSNQEQRAKELAETGGSSPKGIRVSIGGQKHFVTNERLQAIDILLSVYEIAMQKDLELAAAQTRINELEDELKITRVAK